MFLNSRRQFLAHAGGVGAVSLASAGTATLAHADSADEITVQSLTALKALYGQSQKALELGTRSRAILVFPKIVKAGFVVGGQGGDGALFEGEPPNATAFYRIAAASVGLQAGAQAFSYALFFITPSALTFLRKNNGWAVGTGPSFVVLDKGLAADFNTNTLTQDVYAVPFGQKGLMAGIQLEGSKISQIHPK